MSLYPSSASYPPQGCHFQSFYSKHHEDLNRKNVSELRKEADAYFVNRCNLPPVCSSSRKENPQQMLIEILQDPQLNGICFGELHSHIAPKRFLIENLELMKNNGVTTLVIERLKYDEIQQDLDDWLRNEMTLDLPEKIQIAVEKLDLTDIYQLPPPYTYKNLLIKAKEVGMRILACDTSVSAIAGSSPHRPLDHAARIKALNYQATLIMQKECSDQKFIVLTGVDHASKLRRSTIPGLSELNNLCLLILSNATDYRPAGVYFKEHSPYQLGFQNEDGYPHAILAFDETKNSLRRYSH